MAGERSTTTSGITIPLPSGVGIGISNPSKVDPELTPTPPDPPNPWFTIAPGQNTEQATNEKKALIAAKKERQAKWRAAHARQVAAARHRQDLIDEQDKQTRDELRKVEIFTPDPFTKKLGKFNAPPHIVSRSNSPIAFTGLRVDKKGSYRTGNENGPVNGVPYDNFEYITGTTDSFNLVSQAQAELASRSFQRGLLYQDPESSTHLDQSYVTGLRDLWGFQFMYNPHQISISTQVDYNIDHMNTADIANQLAGTQSITFELLINRMVDVSANFSGSKDTLSKRKDGYYDDSEYLMRSYGQVLDSETLSQINARGTEYDLEYLYRAINGDPQETQMLTGSASNYTSDYGYLTGIPLWLRFNNYVKYKGIISSINVVHNTFNVDMVPTLTQVGITFSRIPVIGFGGPEEQGDLIKKNTKHSIGLKPSKTKKGT